MCRRKLFEFDDEPEEEREARLENASLISSLLQEVQT